MEELKAGDLNKLKVAELKKELLSRNLSPDGKKAELLERLAEHISVAKPDIGGDMCQLDEEELLGPDDDIKLQLLENSLLGTKDPIKLDLKNSDEPDSQLLLIPQPPATTQSAIKCLSAEDRQRMRLEKFGLPSQTDKVSVMSPEDRKIARQQRFSLSAKSPSINGKSSSIESSKNSSADLPKEDALRKRLARFGGSVAKTSPSPKIATPESSDKLKERSTRFGLPMSMNEKKVERGRRFGVISL